MPENDLPWHRNELFHDDMVNYPLCSYSLLKEAGDDSNNVSEKEEAGWV
jgi:hypothetical protein